MIVVDSSALIAILESESDGNSFKSRIARYERRLVSTVTIHETAIVMYGRRRDRGLVELWKLLDLIDAIIMPFDTAQARIAIEAYTQYGKGINAKVRLNLADCAPYALAKIMNVPLLFKGNDFAATDITPCV